MDTPQRCQESDRAHRTEPVRLVKRREDGKLQGCAGFVPHAIVITCDHAKPVFPWSKIVIERLPTSSGILPIAVPAFQLVLEMHLLRNDKAQSRIVNLEITCKRRKAKTLPKRIVLSVSNNPFNMDRRRWFIPTQMIRIDHLQHVTTCKPQPSIGRSCGSPKRSTARLHTIKCVKSLKLQRDVRLCPPSLQFRICNYDEPALRV